MNRIIILAIPLIFFLVNCVLIYWINRILKNKVNLYVENQRLENRIDFLEGRIKAQKARIDFLEDRIKVQKARIEDFVKDEMQECSKIFINGKQTRPKGPISTIRDQN